MSRQDDEWFDEAAGPLVRPYAVARGRTTGSQRYDLEMITIVVAARRGIGFQDDIDEEYENILAICREPVSIAEVAALLRLPLAVTKVLISDLIERKLVRFRSAKAPDTQLLHAVLDGIRRL